MRKHIIKAIEIIMGIIYAVMMYVMALVYSFTAALACTLGILASCFGANENETASNANRIGRKFPGVEWLIENFELLKKF